LKKSFETETGRAKLDFNGVKVKQGDCATPGSPALKKEGEKKDQGNRKWEGVEYAGCGQGARKVIWGGKSYFLKTPTEIGGKEGRKPMRALRVTKTNQNSSNAPGNKCREKKGLGGGPEKKNNGGGKSLIRGGRNGRRKAIQHWGKGEKKEKNKKKHEQKKKFPQGGGERGKKTEKD